MSKPQDIINAIALALGAIGGIPQIRRWLKPKPFLKIEKVKVKKTQQENRFMLHLKVLNERKRLRRNCDATNVNLEVFIMDKDHEQWTGIHDRILSPYLITGSNISKIVPFVHSFKTEGNPYTIVVIVQCSEGVRKGEKFAYSV